LENYVAHIWTWSEDLVDHQKTGACEVGFVCERHLQHASHKGEHTRYVLICSHGFKHNTEELVQLLSFAMTNFEDDLIKSAVEPISKSGFLAVNLYFLQLMGNFAELEQ
jgi:3-dehydroquinate dehydratase